MATPSSRPSLTTKSIAASKVAKPPQISRKKIAAVRSDETDDVLQKKLAKLAELQKGVKILKDRMTSSKTDMLTYFEQHPQLQHSKYIVGDYSIRYINRKSTDGISQKLIMTCLAQYFKSKGVPDVNQEVTQLISFIKEQRHSKTVPAIDIKSTHKTNDETSDNDST
jgi:hypothetical protein